MRVRLRQSCACNDRREIASDEQMMDSATHICDDGKRHAHVHRPSAHCGRRKRDDNVVALSARWLGGHQSARHACERKELW
jgi:hypothetical protein